MNIIINPDGTVESLYSDSTRELAEALGVQTIQRASTVEPDESGMWVVRLTDAPQNGAHAGKVLGRFLLREEALKAEVKFIEENIL